jgi:hypothetical protein
MSCLRLSHGTSVGIIFFSLHKGARKEECKRSLSVVAGENGEERKDLCCSGKMIIEKGRSILGNDITMDKAVVSMHKNLVHAVAGKMQTRLHQGRV